VSTIAHPAQGPERTLPRGGLRPHKVRAPHANVPGELLFREVNEQIAIRRCSAGGELGDLELVCECERVSCARRLHLSLAQYEAVRRFPTRFVLVPGHAALSHDRVVAEFRGFIVVEKTGPTTQLAIRLDPRRRTELMQCAG
jgi:hypothetical protein